MDSAVPGISLRFIGVTQTAIKDGSLNNPITIEGKIVHVREGDLTIYHGDEYVFDGMRWICL